MRSPLSGRQPTTKFSTLLVELGVTSRKLSELCGYSKKAVDSWRAGARTPGPEAMTSIAKILDMTEERLRKLLQTKEKAR